MHLNEKRINQEERDLLSTYKIKEAGVCLSAHREVQQRWCMCVYDVTGAHVCSWQINEWIYPTKL